MKPQRAQSVEINYYRQKLAEGVSISVNSGNVFTQLWNKARDGESQRGGSRVYA